ncbi:aminopeptidase N [Kordiimonas pumila]|uniref:Aminopeptidase N n=1 Tax=Kordiimonas pumila TaxID=2161677 RepID=A0ABV7D255_9PROT|nr:aminopeptidase N [Kordiimonas pumila]
MDALEATPAIKQEIFLKDYQPPHFWVDEISLCFNLGEKGARVTAETKFRRNSKTDNALVLDGGPYMALESITVDGTPLDERAYTVSATALTVHSVPDQFLLKVVTKLDPVNNTRLEGLYHSSGNFCTQCEAQGFRHITYYPDRPDVLAKYTVRIEAEQSKFPVLLSNGNRVAEGSMSGGYHYAVWEDPYPKPSYLFALVAGDFACRNDHFVTASGKHVELNIYVAPDDLNKSDYAMASLKRSMKWDEEVFGLEYDLDIYNIVAVSDFNMGAMENKGLNVFNTKYVLASPETATDADFSHVEGVIGHEYFHNWTGNRVTCRDWFQLSLKEGLTVFRDQEFTSDMASRSLKRLDDVRILRLLQFTEDSGPLAHPVRPEKYVEINNFYTATVYNKGAEVIRMMHTLMGAETFRKGMDLYIGRHDGHAVTCEDFVVAMEDASGLDLKQFRLWYSQAGTPHLKVNITCSHGTAKLTIDQSCKPTPGQPDKKPYHMPLLVGWLDSAGNPICPNIGAGGKWLKESCLLELKSPREVFEFMDVPEGAVISLHRQFSAPVKLDHNLSDKELAFLMAYDSDAYARWEAAQQLASRQFLSEVNGKPLIDGAFEKAFHFALRDEETDPAFVAELLTLPSEIDLGQKMQTLDPAGIHQVREKLIKKLALENKEYLIKRYTKLNTGVYSLDQTSVAKRRLKNILLAYISVCPEGATYVETQFKAADNMTDRMAALQLLVHSDYENRQELLNGFYETWHSNALVIDKWFSVQALSKRSDTVEMVLKLVEHPSFSFKNPNRVRSLVSAFSMLNQAAFHISGGAGYRFLAEMIVKVDAYNPQTAAKLVAPLGRWQRLNAVAMRQMQESLKWILNKPNISDDVRELCLKSIE